MFTITECNIWYSWCYCSNCIVLFISRIIIKWCWSHVNLFNLCINPIHTNFIETTLHRFIYFRTSCSKVWCTSWCKSCVLIKSIIRFQLELEITILVIWIMLYDENIFSNCSSNSFTETWTSNNVMIDFCYFSWNFLVPDNISTTNITET